MKGRIAGGGNFLQEDNIIYSEALQLAVMPLLRIEYPFVVCTTAETPNAF